ncbi:hypothetical protein BD779DRAFT_1609689 [Infundibulicybe gibba]|nr:hypothetical protein BD779DRAFT_1609689 [Infundibulicybe gibba]
MSEYWVSKKKYFCKYCDIFIADDAPSRQQHENGLRHKGNTERFIRGLYKTGEKRKKDQEEEARDMARIERAAQAAFAQDIGAGHARPTSGPPVSSTSTAVRKPPPKPSNPFSNYSTAESLGYTDPDAERMAAEMERRRNQGVAGDWEVVGVAPAVAPTPDITLQDDANLKREAEAPLDEEDSRQFKLRKRTVATGLGEIYDPGIIPIKLKKKEVEPEPAPTEPKPEVDTSAGPLKWTKVQWSRPGEPQTDASRTELIPPEKQDIPLESTPEVGFKAEAQVDPTPARVSSSPVKAEESSADTAPPENLFRKRKMPAGGTRGRRQQ